MSNNINVISTVISQLEEQEKSLLGQLEKIQKAKALLIGDSKVTSSTPGKKRGPKPGRKRGRKPGPKPTLKSAAKPGPKPGPKTGSKPGPKAGTTQKKKKSGRVTYFDQINSLLKRSKSPMKPNDIIKKLFDKDGGPDFKLFSRNVYPVFSRSYKNNDLVKKDGLIYLPDWINKDSN